MDISWLAEPQTWIGFATLLILEVVLGIDNLVFVASLAGKVKPALRDKARIVGLALAVVIRIIMLGFMAHIITLTQPLFHLGTHSVSGKDLIVRRHFPALRRPHRATRAARRRKPFPSC